MQRKRMIVYMAEYRLTQISDEKIGKGNYAFADTHDGHGRIYIPVPDAEFSLLSEDNGVTWRTLPPYGHKQTVNQFFCLSDGTLMSLGFENAVFNQVICKEQAGDFPYIMSVYRADSIDDVINGKITSSFPELKIPGLCAGYGDSGNRHSGSISNAFFQMSDGSIFATMYGQFRDDTTLCPYFKDNRDYSFYLYRSWCIVSRDMGESWEFLSNIADVQTYPIADVNAEGYCEPGCIEVEPGHLVCVLRTGGHEVRSPLYCTHSYDYGRTWEPPYEICDWGVLPRLFAMSDGTLCCASGHEHTFLLFSSDNGRTWSSPYIIEECDGKWGRSPSGYVSAFESAPNQITVIFDDPKEGLAQGFEEGNVRNIYIRRYSLEKLS